jgi:FkbM family methyltransferase
MNRAAQRISHILARTNRAAGRVTGYKLARSPLQGTLNYELQLLIRQGRISQAIDVGAHKGGFAESLRSGIGFPGHITSFEPSPDTYEVLQQRAADDPDWTTHNLALADRDGTAPFNLFASDELNSLSRPKVQGLSEGPAIHARNETTVAVARLDSIWDATITADPNHVLLKTDTQGCDMDVLNGTGAILKSIPAILMEVAVHPLYEKSPTINEVIPAMSALGFEITGAFPIHRRSDGVRVIEFDCTFVNTALARPPTNG